MTGRRPLRLAHRGDCRVARENTVAALLAAVAIPACDGVEFDVQLSADGVPILLHDETLERVQGRPERPGEMSAAALQQLDVPTLAEVMAALPRDAFLDIELKGDTGPAAVEVIEAARGTSLERAVVSSFEPAALERVASLRPAWGRWLNTEDLRPATVRLARELGCTGIAASAPAITEASAARVAALGFDLLGWTVRRPSSLDRLTRLGIFAVCVEGAALDAG